MKKLLPAILLLAPLACAQPTPARHAHAVLPTPVLNTADFAGVFGGQAGGSLRQDACHQVRELEFIALPGTPFRIEETIRQGPQIIYRISTPDYPYPTQRGYFVDSRFVKASKTPPPARPRTLPTREQVIERLLAAQGSPYVWGSNLQDGIPQLLTWYPPARTLPSRQRQQWQLRGLDCSGLLYTATNGFTPRNTSALLHYGRAVPIQGLDAAEIRQKVEALDLIVWAGHVMIILDRERLIESRLDCHGKLGGVRVRPLLEALHELLQKRRPLDEYAEGTSGRQPGFVIRRWHAFASRNSRSGK